MLEIAYAWRMGGLRLGSCTTVMLALAIFVGGCGGCDDDGAGGEGASGHGAEGQGGSPTCTDCTPTGDTTYALPSPSGATVWTTTTMDKVLREATPPTNGGDAILVSAAKNEYEPFQVVVRSPVAQTLPVIASSFSQGGASVPAPARHTLCPLPFRSASLPNRLLF